MGMEINDDISSIVVMHYQKKNQCIMLRITSRMRPNCMNHFYLNYGCKDIHYLVIRLNYWT